MNEFIQLIKRAFAWLKELAHRIIRGAMSFSRDIVGWFQGLALDQHKHRPFLMNGNSEQFKEMLRNAPVKDGGVFSKNAQVFKGVYEDDSEEIIHSELLAADMMDAQTRNILENQPIVVLS